MRARSAAPLALAATLFVADLAPLAVTSRAFGADPKLSVITPRGARRGTEATFVFEGDRLEDAAEALFYDSPGLVVTAIEPDEKRGDKKVHVTVKIAPNARVGEHVVQLRCANGVTEFYTLFVGALPEVAEVDPEGAPNSDPETPQVLGKELFEEAGGVTVTGTVENEDLDHYALELDAGQTLSVEVEGMRLASTENNNMDPAIEALTPEGRELASSDDTPLVDADPILHFTAPEKGTYLLRIRDAEFKGNSRGYYRMHVGVRPEAFPRPLAVFPAGGRWANRRRSRSSPTPPGRSRRRSPRSPGSPAIRPAACTRCGTGRRAPRRCRSGPRPTRTCWRPNRTTTARPPRRTPASPTTSPRSRPRRRK